MRIYWQWIIALMLCWPVSTQAVGVSVSPSSLQITTPSVSDAKLTITNISPEPIRVSIVADDFVGYFKISPSESELIPQESLSVSISGDFSDFDAGVQNTNLSVISQALDKKSFNAASGIKIPVTVNITEKYWQWSKETVFIAVFAGFLLVALVIEAIFWILKSRRKHPKGFVNFLRKRRFLL